MNVGAKDNFCKERNIDQALLLPEILHFVIFLSSLNRMLLHQLLSLDVQVSSLRDRVE